MRNAAFILLLGFSAGFILAWQLKSAPAHLTEGTYSIENDSKRHSAPLKTHSNAQGNDTETRPTTTPYPANAESQTAMTALELFKAHILSTNYDDAVALYAGIEQSDGNIMALRSWLMLHLEKQLDNDDTFVDLSDAFLNHDYTDSDILLLVARYNMRRNYFEEAAQTYEFAYQYTYDATTRERIRDTFSKFIQTVDRRLTSQNAWQRLIEHYRYITPLDITDLHQRLRLAELYAQHDYTADAIAMLDSLSGNTLADKQIQTIRDTLSNAQTDKKLDGDAYQLALERSGQHYIATITLNGSDVKLLVDTGASMTSLSRTRFNTIGGSRAFRAIGSRLFNTANGVTKGEVFQGEQLHIGPYELNGAQFVVLDALGNDNYDGLLGMNVLEQFDFKLNQQNATLGLTRRE